MAAKYFWRSGICCAVEQMSDGWSWWCYVGLESDHPRFGRSFISLPNGTVGRVRTPAFAENCVLNQRWWMGFQATACSHDGAMRELKRMADELGDLREEND